MQINGENRPIRVMELRSTYRWGGGPDKTILNSAKMHNPQRIWTIVCYLRSENDNEFSIGAKAASMNLNFVEIVEKKVIDVDAFKKIILLIRQNKIDVLHSRDYKTNLYALLLKKFFFKSLKIVTTSHGWVGSGLKLSLYYTLDKIIVASFDRNFILFKDMVKLFIRKPKTKNVIVIHNAIDPAIWSPYDCKKGLLRKELAIPEGSRIIGYVGRIMPEKDILTMVQVADRIINREKVDAYVVLVGESKDPSYTRKISQHVADHNLQNRFLMIGTRTNLLTTYIDFDLFLMTSIQEGFPNSLLEAMAMKIPAVVPSIDGIPELIKNNETGILCTPKNTEEFSSAILKLLNSAEFSLSIANKARKQVEEELSFNKRLRKMEDAYENLMMRQG